MGASEETTSALAGGDRGFHTQRRQQVWLVSLGSGHRTHIPVPKPPAPQRSTPAQLDDPAGSPGLTSHTARCCRASRPSPGAAVPSLQGCHWHSGSLRAQPGLGIQPGLCQELYVGPRCWCRPPLGSSSSPGSDPWDPVAGRCKGLAWSKQVFP